MLLRRLGRDLNRKQKTEVPKATKCKLQQGHQQERGDAMAQRAAVKCTVWRALLPRRNSAGKQPGGRPGTIHSDCVFLVGLRTFPI